MKWGSWGRSGVPGPRRLAVAGALLAPLLLLSGCVADLFGTVALLQSGEGLAVRVVACTGPLSDARLYAETGEDEPPVLAEASPSLEEGMAATTSMGVSVADLEKSAETEFRVVSFYGDGSTYGTSNDVYFSLDDLAGLVSSDVVLANSPDGQLEVMSVASFDETACDQIPER